MLSRCSLTSTNNCRMHNYKARKNNRERERCISSFLFLFSGQLAVLEIFLAISFDHNFVFFVCLDPSQEFSDGPCLRWLKEINKDFFSLHFLK